MKADIIESYIDKVYGYAVNRTYSQEEADELAQEILFTAVRELPKLKDESRFEPWLWGVAANVTKTFRRYMGKQRAMYSYDAFDNVSYEDDYSDENEDLYDSLRSKVAMLSAIYRDIIILFYYDGLSSKLISEKLMIPEGTVTWRLSEARRKLKKECENMNESALRPVRLDININGNGNYNGVDIPFPSVYINDALSQNILFYCYEEPKTVEELAKLCGVPAYYIEDRLSNLIKHEALSEPAKGKYRTEFIIYSDKVSEYGEKHKYIFEPVVGKFIFSMKTLAGSIVKAGICTAGKTNNELTYLYGIMALEHLSSKYNPVKLADIPVRYDGNRWSYHAHMATGSKYPVRGLGREQSSNLGSRGSYQHISYHFGGFDYRPMMYDNQINICEDILTGSEITDTTSAAAVIERGYVIREDDGKLRVTVPAFTKEQYGIFKILAEKTFADSIGEYSDAVSVYVKGYKKLFPKHFEDDVNHACSYMFLTLYATTVCDLAKEKELLKQPQTGSICDVLIQHK